MNKSLSIFTFIIFLLSFNSFGNAQRVDSSTKIELQKIDSTIQSGIEQPHKESPKAGQPSSVNTFPDIYYEFKIATLDKQSPIKLDYNKDVRKYIDLYLEKRSDKVSEFLGLQELYFPIFEEYLDKYNLPLELKYLPIIESGLNPLAQSSSGAMGLWQLLLNSSKLLGLEVNSYKDERCDPYLSTDAACRYLKYLHSIFNDWQLALAAYNGGPGEVRNAIIRSGGKTSFWQIQEFLPEQTKWYVPAFIAIVYLSHHANEHGINAKRPAFNYDQIDTLMIHEILEFSKLSEKTHIPIETIRFLNPVYRRDYIPETGKPQSLVLPSNKIITFLKLENQIYSRTNDTANYMNVLAAAGDTNGLSKSYYKVGKGDFLHKIALQHGCTLENIRAWNNLTSDQISVGQQLIIWSGKSTSQPLVDSSDNRKHSTFFFYTVKKGDTMWKIAERFKCDSVNAIKSVNNIKDERDLKPGQKLKIFVNN
jgi:membrane-bound lytic murein transglycosylase D